MPVAHTLELPYALGTLFLEIRRWFMEKLNVTFRFQFPDESVGGDPWDHSIGPLVCVADVTVSFLPLILEHSSVITSIGLSVLTCAKQTPYFLGQSLIYARKWTSLEISLFCFMGYPWVLSSVIMGVGVSFTPSSLAYS